MRSCRICGCTETHACVGGCSWVAADLCSACVDEDDIRQEDCGNCTHALGPASMALRQCNCRASEFYRGTVAIDGWCPQWAPESAGDQSPADPDPCAFSHLPLWLGTSEGYCVRCRAPLVCESTP